MNYPPLKRPNTSKNEKEIIAKKYLEGDYE